MAHTKAAARWMMATHGRGVLAPLTGQDSRAWGAFIELLHLYAAADDYGRRHALRAMALDAAADRGERDEASCLHCGRALGTDETCWCIDERERTPDVLDP